MIVDTELGPIREARRSASRRRCHDSRTEGDRLRSRIEELEGKLAERQHLEDVSLLVSGVAHDLNNLVMAIRGNGELARDSISRGGPDADEFLVGLDRAASRAGRLVQQLREHARPDGSCLRCGDLNELLTQGLDLVQTVVPRGTIVSLRLHPDPLPVDVHTVQLEQVLLNLAANAVDASGDRPGTISVASRTTSRLPDELDLRSEPGHGGCADGYAVLEVEDQGCGIDPAIARDAFEAGASSQGGHRGLGLASVGAILRKHRASGRFVRLDRGTRVEIYFPRVPA